MLGCIKVHLHIYKLLALKFVSLYIDTYAHAYVELYVFSGMFCVDGIFGFLFLGQADFTLCRFFSHCGCTCEIARAILSRKHTRREADCSHSDTSDSRFPVFISRECIRYSRIPVLYVRTYVCAFVSKKI